MDFHEPFSLPEKSMKTKLATLFILKSKEHIPKRKLKVAFDSRHPLAKGFEVNYAYWLTFEKGGVGGGHYHNEKAEMFFPLNGSFRIDLEDAKDHRTEAIHLDTKENHALYVPVGICHTVTSLDDGGILLVLATTPGTEEDTFMLRK